MFALVPFLPGGTVAAICNPMNTQIRTASVRVMRSYDYCHFEVVLGVEAPERDFAATEMSLGLTRFVPLTLEQIDATRKEAMRLVDKAVAQYKVAKMTHANHEQRLSHLTYHHNVAIQTPEQDRTPEQKAAIKAFLDYEHEARYDYQDDWQEDDQ
jgi:hypothetical protein